MTGLTAGRTATLGVRPRRRGQDGHRGHSRRSRSSPPGIDPASSSLALLTFTPGPERRGGPGRSGRRPARARSTWACSWDSCSPSAASHSAWWIVGIILVTKSCDIGAYFTGRDDRPPQADPVAQPGQDVGGARRRDRRRPMRRRASRLAAASSDVPGERRITYSIWQMGRPRAAWPLRGRSGNWATLIDEPLQARGRA